MTKEEQWKREAEEKYHAHKIMDFQGFYNHYYYYLGYAESAEPREKRIEELEKEIARLTTNEKSLLAERKIIVKENTKLKEESKKIFNDWLNACDKYGKVNLKLTKAKEIIKNLMVYVPVDLKEYEQAEQFLSGVDRC